jgi:hypothetical protein
MAAKLSGGALMPEYAPSRRMISVAPASYCWTCVATTRRLRRGT